MPSLDLSPSPILITPTPMKKNIFLFLGLLGLFLLLRFLAPNICSFISNLPPFGFRHYIDWILKSYIFFYVLSEIQKRILERKRLHQSPFNFSPIECLLGGWIYFFLTSEFPKYIHL